MISSSFDLLTEGGDARAALASLAHDLSHPLMDVGIAELASMWTYDTLRFTCERPPDMEDHPELSERLRGAFGAALHRQRQPVTATGRLRPHARDVLFAPLGRDAAGVEIAKPFIVRGWISRQSLIVEVRLFGWAAAWQREAASAMLDALQSGIALRGGGHAMRCVVHAEGFEHLRRSFVEVPTNTSEARLHFRTPVILRQRARSHGQPLAVVASVARRVQAMAVWQGSRLLLGRDWWRHSLDVLQISEIDWMRVAWKRYTRNNPGVAVPMEGFLGGLRVSGNVERIALLLGMAETCNIGSHSALGMGWYDGIFL